MNKLWHDVAPRPGVVGQHESTAPQERGAPEQRHDVLPMGTVSGNAADLGPG